MAFSVSFVFKATDKYSSAMKSMAKVTEAFDKTFKALNKTTKDLTKSTDRISKRFTRMGERMTATTAKAKTLEKAMYGVSDAMRQVGSVRVGVFGGGNSRKDQLIQGKMRSLMAPKLNAQQRSWRQADLNAAFGNDPNFKSVMRHTSILDAIKQRESIYGSKPSSLAHRQRQLSLNSAFNARTPFFSKKGLGGAIADADVMPLGLMAAGMAYPLKKGFDSIRQFQDEWAAVRKVAKDDFGEDGLKTLKSDVFELARKNPISLSAILDIVQGAGQSGIEKGQMKEFTKTSIYAEGAFDMGAEDTVDSLSKIRQEFSLTGDVGMKKLNLLAGAINELDNKTAAKARDILMNTMNIGGKAASMGMSPQDTAAFISSYQSLGVRPLQSDNVFNYMSRIATPENMPKSKKIALLSLMSNGRKFKSQEEADNFLHDFGTQMRANPTEGIIRVLTALRAKGKDAAVLGGAIFGGDLQLSGILALVQNIDVLQKHLKIARGEVSNLSGSLEREFLEKTNTINASLTLMQNSLDVMFNSVDEDNELNKIIRELAHNFDYALNKITEFAQAHPIITRIIIGATVLTTVLLSLLVVLGLIAGSIIALKPVWGGIAALFATGGSLAGAAAASTALLSGALQVLTGPIGWLILGISVLYTTWKPFAEFVNGFASLAFESIVTIITELCYYLSQIPNLLTNIASSITNVLGNALGSLEKDHPILWNLIRYGTGPLGYFLTSGKDLSQGGAAMSGAAEKLRMWRESNAIARGQKAGVTTDAASRLNSMIANPAIMGTLSNDTVNNMVSKINTPMSIPNIKVDPVKSTIDLNINVNSDGSNQLSVKSSSPNAKVRMNTGKNNEPARAR